MENHVLWIDKQFFYSLSSLLILNSVILMGNLKVSSFQSVIIFCFRTFFEVLYLKLQLMMSSALQIKLMLLHQWKEVLKEKYWACEYQISRTINLFMLKCFISRVSDFEGSAQNLKSIWWRNFLCVYSVVTKLTCPSSHRLLEAGRQSLLFWKLAWPKSYSENAQRQLICLMKLLIMCV